MIRRPGLATPEARGLRQLAVPGGGLREIERKPCRLGQCDEGDGSDPEGVGLSWDLYRANARVNAAVAYRVPAGPGAACPLVR